MASLSNENKGRSARVSLALKPDTKEKIYLLARLNSQPVNDLICNILDEYVARNEGLIDQLAAVKKEYDDARRKIAQQGALPF